MNWYDREWWIYFAAISIRKSQRKRERTITNNKEKIASFDTFETIHELQKCCISHSVSTSSEFTLENVWKTLILRIQLMQYAYICMKMQWMFSNYTPKMSNISFVCVEMPMLKMIGIKLTPGTSIGHLIGAVVR